MSDLVAFLTARLDEDAAAAKAATPGPWTVGQTFGEDGQWHRGTHVAAMGDEKRMLLTMNTGYLRSKHVATAEHVALNDPARVLREVGFKRGIVEDHRPNYPTSYPKPAGKPYCGSCNQGSWDVDYMDWPCPTILALAAVYDGHPDYDAAWAPGSP